MDKQLFILIIAVILVGDAIIGFHQYSFNKFMKERFNKPSSKSMLPVLFMSQIACILVFGNSAYPDIARMIPIYVPMLIAVFCIIVSMIFLWKEMYKIARECGVPVKTLTIRPKFIGYNVVAIMSIAAAIAVMVIS